MIHESKVLLLVVCAGCLVAIKSAITTKGSKLSDYLLDNEVSSDILRLVPSLASAFVECQGRGNRSAGCWPSKKADALLTSTAWHKTSSTSYSYGKSPSISISFSVESRRAITAEGLSRQAKVLMASQCDGGILSVKNLPNVRVICNEIDDTSMTFTISPTPQ